MTPAQHKALHILNTQSSERIAPTTLGVLARKGYIHRIGRFGAYRLTLSGRVAFDVSSRIGTSPDQL